MKRFLLLLMACATMFASCQKDADLAMESDGGMVDVTVSASMESESSTTRVTTAQGTGSKVNRCIMEVYCNGGLYKRMVTKIGTATSLKATFNVRLVASQTYDFLFWADCSTEGDIVDDSSASADDTNTLAGSKYDKYYNTSKYLTNITANYTNYVGNDEERDAFFGNKLGVPIESSVVLDDISLTRPFGQLNVSTYLTDVPTDMYPKYVTISSENSLCDTFDVSTEKTSASSDDITFTWVTSTTPTEIVDISSVTGSTLTSLHLSTDYIFAPYYDTDVEDDEDVVVEQQLVDFDMTFYDSNKSFITTNDNFKNIPIQRNYRTNVSGELLTKQGTITVTIDPEFDNDSPVTVGVYEVASVDDIAAIVAKATEDTVYIKVAQDTRAAISDDNTYYVYFADNEEVEDLTIEFANVSDKTNIYIGGDSDYKKATSFSETSTTYNGTLNVITGKDANNDYIEINSLYIYADKAHVEYTGYAKNGNVITSKETFVLVDDSKIGTLTVDGGNVEVSGTITLLVVPSTNEETGTIKVMDGGSVEGTSIDASGYTVTYESKEVDSSESFIAAIGSAETINLTDTFTLGSAVTISSPLTINGNGNTITMSGSYNFTLTDDLTLNDVVISSSNSSSSYPFYITASNVDLTIKESKLTLSTAYGKVIYVAASTSPVLDYVNVTVEDSEIYLTNAYQTAIAFQGYSGSTAQKGSSVTVTRSTIEATSGYDGGSDLTNVTKEINAIQSIAIGLGHMDDAVVTVTDSKLLYMAYPIHCNRTQYNYHPDNLTLTIDNSVIKGWCALNMRCDNSTINIKNGSELVGRNGYSDSIDNYFDTIVYAYYDEAGVDSQVHNTELNISDSEIRAEIYGKCNQWVFDNREGESNTVNFKSGTKLISRQYYADNADAENTISISYSEVTDSRRDNVDLVINREEGVTLEATYSDGSVMESYRMLGSELIGEGKEGDPYQIWDKSELFMVGDNYDGSTVLYYKLMADLEIDESLYIDQLGTASNFYGIRDYNSNYFNGVFDGNNKTLYNLNIDVDFDNDQNVNSTTPYAGLFSVIGPGGVVKNLNVVNNDKSSAVKAVLANSGFTALAGAIAGANMGTIDNCSVTGVDVTVSGADYYSAAGGICGGFKYGMSVEDGFLVNNCSYYGNVESNKNAAGIVGYVNNYGAGDKTFSVTNNTLVVGSSVDAASYAAEYCASNYDLTSLWGNTTTGTVSVTSDNYLEFPQAQY